MKFLPLFFFFLSNGLFLYTISQSGWSFDLIILSFVLELFITAFITLLKINYLHDHIDDIKKPISDKSFYFKTKIVHIMIFFNSFIIVSVLLAIFFLYVSDVNFKIIFSKEFAFVGFIFFSSHIISFIVNFIGKKEYLDGFTTKEVTGQWLGQNVGLIAAAVLLLMSIAESENPISLDAYATAAWIIICKIGADLIRHLYKHSLYRHSQKRDDPSQHTSFRLTK